MSDKKRLIKAIVTGMLCGILTSVTLMCIFALVMTKGGLLPTEVINLLLSGFLAVGSFAGGFVAVKINRGAGLIVGALTGAAMLASLVLVSALRGEAAFSMLFYIKTAAAVLGGAAGGILATREKKQFRL